MPEPLPETGILANHSSDFILVGQPASQPAVHTDLFMEVAPRPKKEMFVKQNIGNIAQSQSPLISHVTLGLEQLSLTLL